MKKAWVWVARLGLLGIDRLVKQLCKAAYERGEPLPLLSVKGLIDVTYTENTGAAFSMFSNASWFFVIISSLAVIIILWMLIKNVFDNGWGSWGLVFVAAGAAGNLLDRLLHGAVIDMFELKFINFAIFNVADICITIGAICLLIYLFFYFDKEHRQPTRAARAEELAAEEQELLCDEPTQDN